MLIIPIAIVAALLIYSDSMMHRAILFVVLVIIETIRDVLTWSKKL